MLYLLDPTDRKSKETVLKLCVRAVCQSSSAGDHVTVYEADIKVATGIVTVEISGVEPPDADSIDVERAREAIRCGVEEVLLPRKLGATVHVNRIVIHPIDFKPRRFQRHTVEELRRLLG
jgi:hypothetical protein